MIEKAKEWSSRGKSVQQLIRELESFENKEMKVLLHVAGVEGAKEISLVGKKDGACVIFSFDSNTGKG